MAEGAGTLCNRTNTAHAREVSEKGFDGRSLGSRVVVFHVSHYTLLSSRCKPKLEAIWDRKCLWDKGLAPFGENDGGTVTIMVDKRLLYLFPCHTGYEVYRSEGGVSGPVKVYVPCFHSAFHVSHYTILSTIHLALLEGNGDKLSL